MGDIGQWVFFRIIFLHLDDQIELMRNNMMGGLMQWALMFLVSIVTAWIIVQGWLIVSGRSREPMMALVTNALRIALLSSLAMAFSYKSTDISDLLSNTMPRAVMGVITGSESDPAEEIDESFALMSATFAVMNAMGASSGGKDALLDQVKQATTMSAVGTAGPAVVGGALLLVYKVALGLFIGFGPLFILCLIFPSTKQLFSKWLYYGIGTTFSLGVLAFMVGVASKLVLKVGAVLLAKYILVMHTPLGSGAGEGLNTLAMQQGGLGLILTILLITCPPMAAMFFQGVLGQAMTMYSQFGVGGGQARDPQGNPVGGTGVGQRPSPVDGTDSKQQVFDSRNVLANNHSPRVYNSGQQSGSSVDEVKSKRGGGYA